MKINKPLSVLAAVGIVIYLILNFAVYSGDSQNPGEEEVKPSLSKGEMAEAAVKYVKTLEPLQDPRTFVTFQTRKSLSGYLQQQQLYEDYHYRYGDRYPLDYFSVEVKDAGSNERYMVDINMVNGDILGWSRLGGGQAPSSSAKDIAALYLQKQGYDYRRFELVPSQDAPASRFKFENAGEAVGDSRLQLLVDVQGSQVTGFHAAFSVPAAFSVWFERQNRMAGTLSSFNLYGTALMGLLSIWIAIRSRKQIRFSRGILLTLVFLVIYTVNNINSYPAFKAVQGSGIGGYGTVAFLVFMQFVTVLLALSLYFNLLSGERMWRSRGWNSWPVWSEPGFGKQTLYGMGRGYLLCFFILGLQQLVFFIAEDRFHVWAVNDASDSPFNLLSPLLFPLMAWVAAISEEATYRLFGIALFRKLLPGKFLAVLVPGVIWALGHTQYAIYPVYTRLVEVSILGLVFGYAFLRYGFVTAVFAHAAMDSILMGMSLMFLGTASGIALGAFYMLSPAIIGYLMYRIHSHRRERTNPPPPAPEAI